MNILNFRIFLGKKIDSSNIYILFLSGPKLTLKNRNPALIGFFNPCTDSLQHHVHPCPVCASVYRSSEQRPPVLPRRPAAPLLLAGRWVSRHCETRPNVLFLSRDFAFEPGQHAWEGVYRHYTDPGCSQPTFTLRASGHYAQGNPSSKVAGATELVFKVTQASITPEDEPTAKLLNGTRQGKCGRKGRWEVGAEQDVTTTDGCGLLGIKLPHKEYELFKVELDHHHQQPLLFVGERPTDGSSPDRPHRRPTSFQPPMVLCSAMGGAAQQPPTQSRNHAGGSFSSRQVQLEASSSGTRGAGPLVWLPLLLLLACLLSF